MAEGWKQIWEDIRNSLRGESKSEQDAAPTALEEPAGTPPTPVELAEPSSAEAPPGAVEPDVPLNEPVDAPAAENAPPAEMAAAMEPAEPPSIGDMAEVGPMPALLPHDATRTETEAAPFEADDTPLPILVDPLAAASTESDEAGESSADTPDTTPATLWRRYGWTALTIVLAGVALVNAFYRFGGDRLWAQWTALKPPAPDVVATFDGGKLTTADLEAHFKSLVPETYQQGMRSLETLRLVVQEMVTDELARRWASERKVDTDETFKHTMEHITENVNLDAFSAQLHEGSVPVAESEIQAYYDANEAEFGDRSLNEVREEIRQRLVGQKEGQYLQDYIDRLKSNASITRDDALLDVPEPTDAELRTYYESNTQSYTVTAQFSVDMITIPVSGDGSAARAAADKALLKLRSGAGFAAIPSEVAEARVITNTVVPAGSLGAEWDAVAKELQPDELSDIVRAGDSYAIIRLIQARPTRTLSFEEVRSDVLEAMRREKTEQWMKDNGAKTLFTLKGKQYTLGQFFKEYQELPPSVQAQFAGPQGMKDLADRLIERLLVVEDTYDQLLQVKNKELIDETRLSVLKQMMEQQEVDDKIEVTDKEIRQYYDQNQELMTPPPEARIRYIRIGLGQTEDEQKAARARADEAYKKLVPGLFQQGADFAAVAKEYSEDPETAANGGELPFPVGETNNPLEPPELHEIHTVVLGLDVNQISPPFEVGDSQYIVQPIERTQPKTLSFDEAKPYIKEFLTNQKHDDTLRQLQDRLVQQANLVVYDSALQAYYEQSEGGGATPTSGP